MFFCLYNMVILSIYQILWILLLLGLQLDFAYFNYTIHKQQ